LERTHSIQLLKNAVPHASKTTLLANLCIVLDNGSLQAFSVLDVDCLYIAVQLLLGSLFVITLAGDADAETVRDALDPGFPHFLVELGVETNVLCALLT
jgi:hypothetical protein